MTFMLRWAFGKNSPELQGIPEHVQEIRMNLPFFKTNPGDFPEKSH